MTTVRRVLAVIGVLVGLVISVGLWAIFWPPPGRHVSLDCTRGLPYRCVSASGRIAFHTRFAAGRRAHAVILSRRSLTLPGVVSVEFPPSRAAPRGLSIGNWVSVTGYRETGSHGEQDIHVMGLATDSETVICSWPPGVGLRCVWRRRTRR